MSVQQSKNKRYLHKQSLKSLDQVKNLPDQRLDFSDQLLASMPNAVLVLDDAGNIVYINAFLENLSGYRLADVSGKNWFTTFLPKRDRKRIKSLFAKSIGGIQAQANINAIVTKSGEERLLQWYDHPLPSWAGNEKWLLASGIDITDLEQQVVRRSELRFRTLMDTLPQGIFLKGRDLSIIASNMTHAHYMGVESPKQLIGKRSSDFHEPVLAKSMEDDDRTVIASGESIDKEIQLTLNGRPVMAQTVKTPLRDDQGEIVGVLGIYWDITERKKTEIKLAHANRALVTLSTVNRELVRATNETDLLQAICTAIVEQRGYRLAWVGYVWDDKKKNIDIVASAGEVNALPDSGEQGWGVDSRGMGETSRAVQSGKTQISRDIVRDPHYQACKDAFVRARCFSGIALPMKNENGGVFGVLHVYAEETDAFSAPEVDLLEQMAGDLAFGVCTLRMRKHRDEVVRLNEMHLSQIYKNLEDTISAISKAAEARDPYTAGHQRRVAELAVAIGRKLRLSEDTLRGIRMGGSIHDIGKLQTPVEILTRPAKLSDIEYQIIKKHSEVGYEILKDIHFPWPVADIAYQHHERMDGSGYPQGLKGDQICLEARIVAVADVVEAMSSHRPYRGGLGVTAALAEITNNRGRLYDADVVDACLDVFSDEFHFD